MKNISTALTFGGEHKQFTHTSKSLNCDMRFAIFMPAKSKNEKVPVLYWLSGLTCTDENFMQKAGAFRMASELGIAIVAPDTSPRGDDVPNDDGYDMGQGAGFYINATQEPWGANFHMYDYIVDELPALIEANFNVSDMKSISGHSMGGHGALTIAMNNPTKYKSVSAFSPICNPINCPWGQKAFSGYLGDDQSTWQQYDASVLMAKATAFVPALVDQGGDDNFLAEQLLPDTLIASAEQTGYPLTLNMRDGYDHSYYFISSFIEEHLKFHSDFLKG